MKNIKTYEDFCNEEINLKKAVVGAALGASLLGGMSSCKKEDIKPCNHPTEQTQTQNVKVDVKINFKDYLNDNGPSFSNDIYREGYTKLVDTDNPQLKEWRDVLSILDVDDYLSRRGKNDKIKRLMAKYNITRK